MVKVRVPATSANLGAGFDALGLALNLYNEVEMTFSRESKIQVFGEGQDYLENNEDNLVFQTAKYVFDYLEVSFTGLTINLSNDIPLMRGLGSSAAAIVGGAVAANELSGKQLTKQQLLELIIDIEGHLDNISPAMFGGFVCSSTTREHDFIFRKFDLDQSDLQFFLIIPQTTLSTKSARESLPKTIPFEDAVDNIGRTAMLLMAFQKNDHSLLLHAMDDNLHEPYRSELVPGLSLVLNKVRTRNTPISISGAGPSLIAVTSDQDGKIREIAKNLFREQDLNCEFKILSPDNTGATKIE